MARIRIYPFNGFWVGKADTLNLRFMTCKKETVLFVENSRYVADRIVVDLFLINEVGINLR